MREVTIEEKGPTHSYILLYGSWIASCLPEHAELFQKALQAQLDAASANRNVLQDNIQKEHP